MPTYAETAIIAPIIDAAVSADLLGARAPCVIYLSTPGSGSRPLTESARFTHEGEREASLRLRAGDPDVLRIYHQHGRLLDACTGSRLSSPPPAPGSVTLSPWRRPLLLVDTNEKTEYVWRDSRALSPACHRPGGACHRPGVTGDGVGRVPAGSASLTWSGRLTGRRAPVDRPGNQVAVSEGIYRCGSAALGGESDEPIVRHSIVVGVGGPGLTGPADRGGVDHAGGRLGRLLPG